MTEQSTAVAQRCRECGAAVPPSLAICPRCRSADLVADATARAMSVAEYDRFHRRRRMAIAATAATTLLCMLIALGIGLAFQGFEPGAKRGTSMESGLMPLVRALLFVLVINPMVIAGLGLVLGLFSYRLWHRLFTGEHPDGGMSVLNALGGRARPN